MRQSSVARGIAACVLGFGATCAFAQTPSRFATRVVAFDTNGNLGGGVFRPENALGAPTGGGRNVGSTDVHSLGVGGSLTLGFDVAGADGPGADLLVFENAFTTGDPTRSFAEVAFVEVSSNGTTFARFPARYLGPDVDPGAFGTVAIGGYDNLAGSTPVLAGTAPGTDPFDVVLAGGDAFDLADLRTHPDVVAGRVDLGAIRAVRLVDVRSGVDRDARGIAIRDAGGGSADIDAVAVLHRHGALDPRSPRTAVAIPADGRFAVTFEDPDGLGDLDASTLRCALFGLPVSPGTLLGASSVEALTATSVTFRFAVPLPPGLAYRCAFTVDDRAGSRSGASAARDDGR
jgi:hypothetical protein